VFTDDWWQERLIKPEVVEARLSIGVVPSTDHLQLQVEVFDPATNILVAMWSRPHISLANARPRIEEVLRELLDALEGQGLLPEPFPDPRPD
jgi:hypothetical protein